MDEFDKPVNAILSRGNFLEKIEEAKQIAKIVSDIIAPCSKGISPSTKQIVLTGILNSEVQEGSSEINNLYKEGVMTGQLASYFGFNDEEVNWVLEQAFIFTNNYKELLFDQLKYWYNGQVIGQNMEVFTPSSVMRYLLDLKNISQELANKMPKFEPYWTSTETTLILKSFAEISRDKGHSEVLEKLIKISYGDEVEYNMDTKSSLYSILSNDLELDSNFEQLVFHYLLRSGYITQSTAVNNRYKLPAKEVEKIFKMQIQNYWLKEIVFKGTWNEFEQLAKALDFYNDDVEVIREAIAELANIAKKGLDTLNESTFEKILFTAFTYSKGASQYKIATQASSGEGFLDVVIYFSDRADIYELKFDSKGTVYNVDTTLKSAFDQIYKTNYMATVMHKIKEEKSKISVESIKLIPMLLHKMGSEANYQCQVGEVKEHAIKEAIEISQERTDNIGKKNIDKLTLDELKEKINKSTYNQKKALIKKLGDTKKENFTKEEALKALNDKSSAAVYKLVEKFFNGNKAANQSKKKKGLTDEFTQKKSHDLTYHSDELDWVLKERMQQESISQKVMRLDTHKSYEYDSVSESVSNLLRKVENVLLQNNALVIIVPYAEEEHFIGLIFQLSKEGALFVDYMDSENNEPEVEVKEEILKRNVTINKIIVSEQKYSDNCGIETIENFIGYLKAEDLASRNISQDEAIEIHKVLRGSETPNNPLLNEGSAKTLEDTMSIFARLGIDKPKKRTWKEFKEMHGIKDDSPYIAKRMLKKAIPNNKSSDDFFKKFKGSEGLDGMTQREIEENLQMLMSSYKLSSMGDIVISKKVLNLSNINTEINQWIKKGENKKYAAVVKLENEEGQLHAVLLQIEKMSDIFKIKIN